MARRTPPIEDYLAITQLKAEYCYRIDDKDYEAWVDLFTDDGAFGITGVETFEGREELRRFAETVFDQEYAYTAHIVTNPRIEVDGEEASGQWYLYLPFTGTDGSIGWTQSRYEDTYRKEDGEWKVVTAVVTRQASHRLDHSGVQPSG